MALYKDKNNGIHDDMDGAALPLFPEHLGPFTLITEEEATSLLPQSIPLPSTRFSSLEFLERFTEAEQLAVVSATLGSPQVKLWYDKLLAAEYVDLNDPRTEGGIDALIAAGLITADRKAALMTPEASA